MSDSKKPRSEWEWDINREEALRAHDRHTEMCNEAQRAAIESANIAIRALILVNGGAVVAMLAFAGALAVRSEAFAQISTIAESIRWFALGVGSAALASALAYLINMIDADLLTLSKYTWDHPYVVEEKPAPTLRKVRIMLHICALGCAIAALALFFFGVVFATDSIGSIKPSQVASTSP